MTVFEAIMLMLTFSILIVHVIKLVVGIVTKLKK